MVKDPYAPPASKEEQFHEVARLLGTALLRWHKLNRGKMTPSSIPTDLGRHSLASDMAEWANPAVQ